MSDDKTVRDGFLSSVVTQIASGDPPEARQTYDRLLAEGQSDSQAIQLIGLALKKEMRDMISQSRGFDNDRYVALLRRLPEIEA
jgi:hypothetical protein